MKNIFNSQAKLIDVWWICAVYHITIGAFYAYMDNRVDVPVNIKAEVVNAEIEKRLDENSITYYVPAAVQLLQVSLQSEGFDLEADGIFGAETLTAITRWQEGQR